MMNEKICPLSSMPCLGEKCEFWIRKEDQCAVSLIAEILRVRS
jgi:hypothetical protein